MKKKVIMAFKTHFDIGFTDLSEEIIKKYAGKMLDEVLATCEATSDMGRLKYIWTMPAWPLAVSLAGNEPGSARRVRAEKLIENGQLVWHALPFTSHFDFLGLEDALRGFRYASELSRKYKRPIPVAAKMTDVPGHGRMLPSVLAAAGVKFLHLGCNEFSTPPAVPRLFWWEGPDGSRVLTMYSKGGYGSDLTPPEDWPFPVWLALMHTQDNMGPQSAGMIRALAEDAQAKMPDAEIMTGTLDDFYHALSECDLSGLPVLKKDLADTWIHGVGTYPREVSQVRAARRLISTAEKAFSVYQTVGRLAPEMCDTVQSQASAVYDELILFGEHTWGLDVKTFLGSGRVYEKAPFLRQKEEARCARMEESWREQSSRAENAYAAARAAADGIGARLAAAVAAADERIVVFNPCSVPFSRAIDIHRYAAMLGGRGLKNLETGEDCPVCTICGRVSVVVRNMPAMSYITLVPYEKPALKQAAPRAGYAIENDAWRIELDEATGAVKSLYDKRAGREWADEKAGVFGLHQYDRYGLWEINEYLRVYGYRFTDWGVNDFGRMDYPYCGHETFLPSLRAIERREDGLNLSATFENGRSAEEYGDAQRVTVVWSLPPEGGECCVELRLERKAETPYVESGNFVLPLRTQGARVLVSKTGGVYDPACDIADDANHVHYATDGVVDVTDEISGLTIVSKDIPLFSLGAPGTYRFAHTYEQSAPTLYFNTFNNMWGTNFPQWIGGDFRYRFILLAHAAQDGGAGLRRGMRLMEEPLALMASGPAGPMRPSYPGASYPEALEITTIAPSGEGFLIRVHDISGRAGTHTVTLPPFIRRIEQRDLFGRPLSTSDTNAIELTFGPYGIQTLYALV